MESDSVTDVRNPFFLDSESGNYWTLFFSNSSYRELWYQVSNSGIL